MNINLTPKLQLKFNLPRTYPQEQQLSPLSRKNVFSKTKKTISPQSKEFNPHLEKLNTNYYVKENSIVPYSYTVAGKCMLKVQQKPLNKFLKVNKAKSSGSKILSLKEFSCIETVSQKSGKENQSDQNSQLEISRTFKPKQINSEISSPFDFKNFQSTFTTANLKRSELNFMKSHEIPKIAKNNTQFNPVHARTNRIKLINNEAQNDRKTYKNLSNRKIKTSQNYTLSRRVFQVKISPTKKGLSFSNTINVHESSVIFDYDKFYKNKSRSPSPSKEYNSIFHPINEKLFKFFGEDKKYANTFRISNQNDSFIDIVKQINSPQNKVGYHNFFINQPKGLINLDGQNEKKDSFFSSDLTCLVKQGPRSYSVGNELRKLSGHKNNFIQNKKESERMKTQTRPTTGRSQYFNQFELHTPAKESSQKYQNCEQIEFTNSNKINFRNNTVSNNSPHKIHQDQQFIKNLFYQNTLSPQKHEKTHTIVSQQQITRQNPSIQRISNSKDSKRRSSKGISVLSKEKKPLNTQNNVNQRSNQNIVMASKLKSLQQIKNMKKLSLASPKKIETHQVGSPIRYKKQ